jgi:hypothetical protein
MVFFSFKYRGRGVLTMKIMKVAALSLVGTMLTVQQAFAGATNGDHTYYDMKVPEMDGTGAIIAIGLVIGLVALIREKFFHK